MIKEAREVSEAFLKLGLTSFGGPVAHIGYFHHEFVERRKWFDERTYADLVALCQFLPGPVCVLKTSSTHWNRQGTCRRRWSFCDLTSGVARLSACMQK
jgi:chromate transport protein ChrA